jgi:L-lactate dehydrogenase complex protein LldG
MTSPRDDILDKIRRALAVPGAPAAAPAPSLNAAKAFTGDPVMGYIPDPAGWRDEFDRRFIALGGEVHQADSNSELDAVLARILGPLPEGPVTLGDSARKEIPDLDVRILRLGRMVAAGSPAREAVAVAGITSARRVLAYSGTVLVTSRDEGDLGASLVPPVHLILTRPDRLIWGVPDALSFLAQDGPPRCGVLITGPSRTADIELTLVRGVHGPGSVHLIWLGWAGTGETQQG